MMARMAIAVEVSISRSKSLARRRLRPSQAKVRSMTQRLGSRWKPSVPTRALDDLEPQPLACRRTGGDLALVAGIGKQVPEPGEAPVESGADQGQAVAVLDVGGMDDQPQRQAQRVGEQMSLAAVDLLAGIEPPRATRLGCLDALAVDDPGGRRGLPAGLLTCRHEQRRLDASTRCPPARTAGNSRRPCSWVETRVGSIRQGQPVAAGRARRSAPRAARSSAAGRRAWPPAEGLDQREFLVRHVGCVAAARASILLASGSSPHRL